MNFRDFLPSPPWEGPPLPEAFLRAFKLTPERIALVQRINDLIRQRKTYGLRRETVQKAPSWILSWSNASAEWWPWYGTRLSAGDVVTLDANQILVQARHADIRAVLGYLEPLPLYSYSFEARQIGFGTAPPPETRHWTWLYRLLNEWEEQE